ncbi:rhodanese-like domain-containing protein, partial [Mitsuaria sp. TWR114]|uniref:rhodanese-like domain-containing protein n=1 Tax=Mitsuaria sp. TWR114 TaxID=2601731 RepID=UPI003857A8F8
MSTSTSTSTATSTPLAGKVAFIHGGSRGIGAASARRPAREGATALARRAHAQRIDARVLADWLADPRRSTYRFDVRGADEYARGHRPGFRHAPGGQLIQETDHHVPVRGARIVLSDDDGIRASMAAAWLAQMGLGKWRCCRRIP